MTETASPDGSDRPLRVGLDAFGTDHRPRPELEAARLAADAGLALALIGDAAILEPELLATPRLHHAIELIHAPTQIAMGESPARAVRAKPDASLCVAIDRLAAGHLDAVVSAGNSGAILAAALFRLGRLTHVDRPAIATLFPRVTGDGHTVVLDAGANVECKALNLVQFAVIGSAYASVESGSVRPRVAVLSNGAESVKGTPLTRAAHEILSRGPTHGFEFVGYVEPNALFESVCDVAVTDGWTGNVMLKLAEGAMTAWPRMLTRAIDKLDHLDPRGESSIADVIGPALQTVARQVDPEAHGGAPLLGVDGAVMICHGASGPVALLNALTTARRYAARGLTQSIGRALEDHRELFELARNLR